jgi:hypothetical protein
MTMGLVRLAITMTAMLGIAVSSSNGASAQTPPAKKETELVAAGYKRLSGPEISALLVGNTTYIMWLVARGPIKEGTIVAMYWRERTRTGMGPDKKKTETNWWIEGDKSCGESRVQSQGHGCGSVFQVGTAYQSCLANGDCIYFFRVVPGNPENL